MRSDDFGVMIPDIIISEIICLVVIDVLLWSWFGNEKENVDSLNQEDNDIWWCGCDDFNPQSDPYDIEGEKR